MAILSFMAEREHFRFLKLGLLMVMQTIPKRAEVAILQTSFYLFYPSNLEAV